jgi:hypothetical protein
MSQRKLRRLKPPEGAMRPSSETEALFTIFRELAAPEVASAIESSVLQGADRSLCRINALDFAAKNALDEEPTIAGFLHAARLGLFVLNWNVLCPGCGGVLESGASLKNISHDKYTCALCAAGYEPTLDEVVEVTFTVSPSVRRIAAHEPHTLPLLEFYRQIFWGSGFVLPDDETLERISRKSGSTRLSFPPARRRPCRSRPRKRSSSYSIPWCRWPNSLKSKANPRANVRL